MQVTVSERDKDNCVLVSFETEKGRAKDAYSRTLKKLGKDLTIKGFRKGKVPTKVVEEHFGRDYIKAETLDNKFLSDLFEEAFQAQGLKVMHISNVEKVEFNDPEDRILVEAKVELFPEIALPDYKAIKVSVKVPKIDVEEQIKQTLDKVRTNTSKFTESPNGTIAMGDEVIFDFDGSYQKEDGSWEPKPGMKAEGYQVIIEPGRFIANFLEQMVGMKVGDEKELDVDFPEGYHDPDLSGKPAKFKVKIHKISKPEQQELNDEFAKSVGHDNLDDLLSKVREELVRINESNRRYYTGEALVNKLIEDIDMSISESMIQREFDSELRILQKSNRWTDAETEEFKETLDMDKELEAAQKKIRRSVILTSIINKENIEANEEDIQKAFSRLNLPPNFDISKANMPAIVSRLNLDVVTQKAIDVLIESASVEYQEVDQSEFEQEHGHVHGPHCNH